jgi:hypothetical protein
VKKQEKKDAKEEARTPSIREMWTSVVGDPLRVGWIRHTITCRE